jgi:hypothetical protein
VEKRERPPGLETARALLLALTWASAFNAVAQGAEDRASPDRATPTTERPNQRTEAMKIRLTLNGKTMTATLIDNATARDFLSLLPMTLTLDDYAETEKISYLSSKAIYSRGTRGQRSLRR